MKIIIIGNGVAGISAAEAIRNRDKNAEIVIYSDEKYYHYSRPRIIEYLSGRVDADRITIKKENFYKQNDIKLNLNSKVIKINPGDKKITLSDGKEEKFDKLIIAAGASSFLPPVSGSDAEGVFTLRTIDDADKIIFYAKGKKKAAVIGGGLLGIESAMSLKELGPDVTIVEMSERLLPRQLDRDGADVLQKMLEEKGMNFLLSKQTSSIVKDGDLLKINFKDGTLLKSDVILFSAGIRSNLKIVENTGIEFDRGIKVNDYLQTNIPDIYAAGDIAEHKGIIYGIWPAAKEQGTAAGLNAAGEKTEYRGSVQSTKLKVAGIELASIGNVEHAEGVEIRTKQDGGIFKRMFLRDNKLIGAILIGNASQYQKLQDVIKSGQDVLNIEEIMDV
ncbi:MAG: NAD(P)/FAD-dependent oxidoreductase [Candidatus Goldbacteria bacterium]|nr:NAD(P)/FAD-dependent oxidoreductase [Candidatus Goldiibacteriota bacterium]